MKQADLVGRVFGRLTVLSETREQKQKLQWRCRCECGRETVATTYALQAGKKRSCGCLHIEQAVALCTTHGHSKSPLYNTWRAMVRRCHSPNSPTFHRYGGRGINVCEQWRSSFAAFESHVGPRPSSDHSLDRIDNDGNYEPGNVRWSTVKAQGRNMRKNVYVRVSDEVLVLAEAAERFGVKYITLYNAVRRNGGVAKRLGISAWGRT